jgi:hypothetical protein
MTWNIEPHEISVPCRGKELFQRCTSYHHTFFEIKFASLILAFTNADTILCACQHDVEHVIGCKFFPSHYLEAVSLSNCIHFLFTHAKASTRCDVGNKLHYLLLRKYVFLMYVPGTDRNCYYGQLFLSRVHSNRKPSAAMLPTFKYARWILARVISLIFLLFSTNCCIRSVINKGNASIVILSLKMTRNVTENVNGRHYHSPTLFRSTNVFT